jgi:hypothetical protein
VRRARNAAEGRFGIYNTQKPYRTLTRAATHLDLVARHENPLLSALREVGPLSGMVDPAPQPNQTPASATMSDKGSINK